MAEALAYFGEIGGFGSWMIIPLSSGLISTVKTGSKCVPSWNIDIANVQNVCLFGPYIILTHTYNAETTANQIPSSHPFWFPFSLKKMTSGQGARMPFQHRVSPTCQSSRQCP
jgi:hypothetical protein